MDIILAEMSVSDDEYADAINALLDLEIEVYTNYVCLWTTPNTVSRHAYLSRTGTKYFIYITLRLKVYLEKELWNCIMT